MGNQMIIEDLKQSLSKNDYKSAEKIFKELTFREAFECIDRLAFDTKNISLYTFIVSVLLQKETPELHYLASNLMAMPFCFLEGGYAAGLYHARRALELDPDNVDYKEYLLTFYGLPDQLMTKAEALELAKEVLKVYPDSGFALKVIEE